MITVNVKLTRSVLEIEGFWGSSIPAIYSWGDVIKLDMLGRWIDGKIINIRTWCDTNINHMNYALEISLSETISIEEFERVRDNLISDGTPLHPHLSKITSLSLSNILGKETEYEVGIDPIHEQTETTTSSKLKKFLKDNVIKEWEPTEEQKRSILEGDPFLRTHRTCSECGGRGYTEGLLKKYPCTKGCKNSEVI